MELATVAVAALALRSVRFPFLTAPLAFVLWYMSMDLAPMIFADPSTNQRGLISVAVGGVMLAVAFVVDRRTREDFAFWLYLFGLMAFWGGLSAMRSDSEARKFGYFCVNLGLIALGPFLQRRAFVVFGGLGAFGYISYLAWHVFAHSLSFPFVLTGIGLGIISGAVLYARNRQRIDEALLAILPTWIEQLRPLYRGRQAR